MFFIGKSPFWRDWRLMPRSARRLLGVALCLVWAAFSLVPAAMPLEIDARMWDRDPGPAQDGPGAPKLLIVRPHTPHNPCGSAEIQYAGRVEPVDSAVTLNGRKLRVDAEGVFTGLAPLAQKASSTWTFKAAYGGETTTVEREVKRSLPPKPPAAWPPAFAASPVAPSGETWLPAGERFSFKAFASSGCEAQYRLGARGEWKAMKRGGDEAGKGTVYSASLTVGEPSDPPKTKTIEIRLKKTRNGVSKTETLATPLKLGALPQNVTSASVTNYLTTLFENKTGWDVAGVIPEKTELAIERKVGSRAQAVFPGGRKLWIEAGDLRWDRRASTAPKAPALPEPDYECQGVWSKLSWPGVKGLLPVTMTYDSERLSDQGYWTILGARRAAPLRMKLPGGMREMTIRRRSAAPPRVTLDFERDLWGYDIATSPAGDFTLRWRTASVIDGATAQSLAGLRVMLDAGHGGDDWGALSPYGVTEADLNLVQTAWLERELRACGATVGQMRTTDVYVTLDDRVREAIAWAPDIFISLHHNSVYQDADPFRRRGPEVYYHTGHSRTLAETVFDALDANWPQNIGGKAKRANLRLNRNLTICPSILIESAFICNPKDDRELRRKGKFKATACAIVRALEKYVKAAQ